MEGGVDVCFRQYDVMLKFSDDLKKPSFFIPDCLLTTGIGLMLAGSLRLDDVAGFGGVAGSFTYSGAALIFSGRKIIITTDTVRRLT